MFIDFWGSTFDKPRKQGDDNYSDISTKHEKASLNNFHTANVSHGISDRCCQIFIDESFRISFNVPNCRTCF